MSDTRTEHSATEHHPGAHPSPRVYVQIAVVLAILTMVEVAAYYIPTLQPVLAPLLILLSAAKFALVVMFFMHLKFDSKLFSVLFTGPLLLTGAVLLALMTLFRALFG